MIKSLKLALQSFKRNYKDYLAVSFVFSVIAFLGILIGQSIIGLLLAYIVIIVPLIISLKFLVFQSHDKEQVEYRSLKIGFLTLFKSIKIYFIVVLKPLLISFFIGMFIYSFFMSSAINIASEEIPTIMDSLSNYQTVEYAYEEMLKVDGVTKVLNIGMIISVCIGLLLYISLKLKRDFIPFMAFEMPINSKRAISMNAKILKGQYWKLFISNLIVVLLYTIPIGAAYLTGYLMATNVVYSQTTISLISSAVFCVLAGPITTFKQLNYIYSYKSFSKPFKEDFDNELKNVIKEIEELQKIINKNDEK